MKLSRPLIALFVSYLVVIFYYVNARISLSLCILIFLLMFFLVRHSLPLLVLLFLSLNPLIYTVSVRSLPPYVSFSESDLFRVCLYFAIFTITSTVLFAGNSLITTKPSLFESARMIPSKLLPLFLYIVSFAFLLTQGRTYNYSIRESFESLSLNSLYDYSFVILACVLSLLRTINRQFVFTLLLTSPFIFLELYSGRRVGLLGIFLLLLFSHSFTRNNSRSWQSIGYFAYLPVLIPLFVAIKLIGSIRQIAEVGQYGISPSFIFSLVLPSESTTTELQSLFTTAHYYSIDFVRSGFFSLLDPLRHFFSAFAGASSFDMIKIVDSRFFTLGGLLPVSSFSSIPIILAPILILFSLVSLGFFFGLVRLLSVDSLTIAAVTIVVLPRCLLYNFSILPRSLLLSILITIVIGLLGSANRSPSNA